MSGSDLQEVKVKFKLEAARYIREYRYTMGFIDGVQEEGYEVMTFMTSEPDIFARWLLQFSNSAEVLRPASLKERVLELHQLGMDAYLDKEIQ